MRPLALLLLPSAVAAARPGFLDHTCPGGQQTCEDDSTCCAMGGGEGYMCCETTASGPCCGGQSKAGGGCCTHDETCCSDDQDYSCCMQQNTYCVAKDPSVPSLPSRCCPRWTVGCTTGSVGCCDPAQPWQWFLGASPAAVRSAAQKPSRAATDGKSHGNDHRPHREGGLAGNLTAYVLVVNGVIGGLEGMTVNTATGQIETHTRIIKSFDDDPAGESTREFMFDTKRKVFYYVDANFTAGGGARPAGGREMYLYTVDPVAGTTQKQTVTGAVDFPVGYTYHPESDAIIMGVEQESANDTSVLGFDFFSLNPETAAATRLSSIARASGATESDPGFYAGFHRGANTAGTKVYRLGYELVTQQTDQGLGVVSLNEAHANATWLSEISPLHDYYMTMDRVGGTGGSSSSFAAATTPGNDDSDVFVSLAPRKDLGHDLDLVQWTDADGGKSAKVIAQLSNAHVPSVARLGSLGYLASAINGNTWAALVVEDAAVSELDRWALAVVDVTPGANSSATLPLVPRDVAGTISISGLGLA